MILDGCSMWVFGSFALFPFSISLHQPRLLFALQAGSNGESFTCARAAIGLQPNVCTCRSHSMPQSSGYNYLILSGCHLDIWCQVQIKVQPRVILQFAFWSSLACRPHSPGLRHITTSSWHQASADQDSVSCDRWVPCLRHCFTWTWWNMEYVWICEFGIIWMKLENVWKRHVQLQVLNQAWTVTVDYWHETGPDKHWTGTAGKSKTGGCYVWARKKAGRQVKSQHSQSACRIDPMCAGHGSTSCIQSFI